MDSNDLKKWQANRLNAALRPAVRYLQRLLRRTEERGFPPQDPPYQLVARAYQAMHHLHIELHYRSCDGGVGRPSA